MVNLVIANDELTTVKKFLNTIIEMNNNVKVIGISSNGEEVLEKMKKSTPDILLLDLKITNMNEFEILDKLIKYEDKCLNKTKIIIISEHIEEIYIKEKHKKYIYAILPKPYNMKILSNLINEVNEEVETCNIRKFINKEMDKFNFNRNTNSYKYLKDAIFQVIRNIDLNFELERDIYKRVAQINNKKNELVIKWSIEKLMERMYINTKCTTIQEYFNFTEDIKPTTKLFIRTIAIKYYELKDNN